MAGASVYVNDSLHLLGVIFSADMKLKYYIVLIPWSAAREFVSLGLAR